TLFSDKRFVLSDNKTSFSTFTSLFKSLKKVSCSVTRFNCSNVLLLLTLILEILTNRKMVTSNNIQIRMINKEVIFCFLAKITRQCDIILQFFLLFLCHELQR